MISVDKSYGDKICFPRGEYAFGQERSFFGESARKDLSFCGGCAIMRQLKIRQEKKEYIDMSEQKITKDTVVAQIPELNPAAVDVLWNLGMGCVHCIMADNETVEEAAAAHGFNLDELLKVLNEAK